MDRDVVAESTLAQARHDGESEHRFALYLERSKLVRTFKRQKQIKHQNRPLKRSVLFFSSKNYDRLSLTILSDNEESWVPGYFTLVQDGIPYEPTHIISYTSTFYFWLGMSGYPPGTYCVDQRFNRSIGANGYGATCSTLDFCYDFGGRSFGD